MSRKRLRKYLYLQVTHVWEILLSLQKDRLHLAIRR